MRLRCPRCSTIIDAQGTMITCPACGFSAPAPGASTPVAPPPPPVEPWPTTAPMAPAPGQSYAPPMMSPAMSGPRVVGKTRSPWAPVLLPFITFGIYSYVWYWKISNEMDRFVGRPDHKKVRTGVVLAIIAAILAILGFILLFGAMGAAGLTAESTEEDISAAAIGGALGFFFLLLVAAVLGIIGLIMIIVGLNKLWKNLEADDRARFEPEPTNVTTLLMLYIIGVLVFGPLVLVAMYMTQKSLNRTWAAYSARPPNMPPPAPAPA